MPDTPPCPLCQRPDSRPLAEVDGQRYFSCSGCQLRFLHPSDRPDARTERAHYDLHENLVDDPGYRRFLARLANPLLERLKPASHGLDFGCGPGPALASMLTEAGHSMKIYDPFYAPDSSVLVPAYDFITCTEVAEHLHDPAAVFERLDGLLEPDGWLGLMTRLQTDDERFARWHYRRDPTHVVFYREETLRWLGQRFGWSVEIIGPDVMLAQKHA